MTVDVRFQRRQVVPRPLHRIGGDDVGNDVQEPPVIAHQRRVRPADAIKVCALRHVYRSHWPAFPVAEPEVVGRPHPVLGSRVYGLHDAHDGHRDVLRRLRVIAFEHHQPRLLAHSPAQQARGVHSHHALDPGAPAQVRTTAVIHGHRIRRPTPIRQARVLGESGYKKRPAQRNVVHAVGRSHLGQRQAGQHLGVPVYVPQQIAHVLLDNPLNIRAQGRVVLRTHRPVAHHHLGVDDGRRRYRQRVAQARFRQRLRVHRAQRHDGHRRQHAKRGDGQQPPRRTHPPGQQP